jgi:hypothetical protein
MALNRFVNYWASVELLAEFLYARIGLRQNRDARKRRVLELLSDLTGANCMEKVRQAAGVISPTARMKLEAVVPVLSGGTMDGSEFFERSDKGQASLYDIRNDIAHGNHADHELEFTDLAEARITELQDYSRRILVSSILRAGELGERLDRKSEV